MLSTVRVLSRGSLFTGDAAFVLSRAVASSTTTKITPVQHNAIIRISGNNNVHVRLFHTSGHRRSDETGFFSSLAGRLKTVWRGEGKKEPTEEEAAAAQVPKTEEQKEEEASASKLMDAITEGRFNLEDYRAEIARLVKMAKAKGYVDTVKEKVTGILGKGSNTQADRMKQVMVDFNNQIELLDHMTEAERKNPDAFYDHAFKVKTRISEAAGKSLADFNDLMEKYENSRVVYMILHQCKKANKSIPTKAEDLMTFVKDNAHLLPDKEKRRMARFASKQQLPSSLRRR